jgi:CBS domain-containing protein
MLVAGHISRRRVLVRCDKCGTDLPPAALYCFKCGSRVGKVVTEEFSVNSDDLVKKVKDILHEGNVNRIIVRDEQGKILLEVPATAGLIGAILAPWLAALGAIAALVTECTISVERRE